MHQDDTTRLMSHLYRIKKILLMLMLCTTLSFTTTSQAIDLANPEMCSSGITNMMSDMGLMAYQVADFLNSFCKSIPFFGMFCPDLDQIAGAFFSNLLANPDLTLDMMACADHNPSMLNFMLHVMSENPELLNQMSSYLGQTGNGTSKGCQLGELLTTMALRHNNLKGYLFAEMNSYVYANLAKNMQCQTNTTVQLAELISRNPQELEAGTAFDQVMRKLGSVESDTDGNEVSNERMFYAIFNNIDASNHFLDAVEQLEPASQGRVLDFVFLGKTVVTQSGCNPNNNTCTTTEVIHDNQAYFNMYGLLSGFDNAVMSSYLIDPAYPPIPESTVPANALFARMAPMLMTPSLELSDYGISFFGTMLTGTNIYQWQPAIDTLTDMMAIMDLGHLPFTIDDLMPLMPILVNAEAPAPRNILDNSDCAEDFSACLTPIDCDEMAGYWYDNTCNALQQIQTAHFEGELFYSQRKDIGPFTVDNDGDFRAVLSGTGDIDLYVRRNYMANELNYDCKSDNPATSEESCVLYGEGEYWISLWGDWEAQTSYTLDVSNDPNVNGPPNGNTYNGTGCAIDLPTCYTPQLCDDAGGYWYGDICNIIPPVQTAEFTEQLSPGSSRDIGGFTVDNTGNFLVELSGTGDVDVYVRRSNLGNTANLTASPSTHDCQSATAGTSTESCELFGEGVYWIHIVNNGNSTAAVDLDVSNDPIYTELTTNLDVWESRVTDYENGKYLVEVFGEGFTDTTIYISTDETYSDTLNWYEYRHYGPFDATLGNFTASLNGTGDADLYVDDDGQPLPGSHFNTCNSESGNAEELCSIPEAGQYRVMVDAVDDTSYTLSIRYQQPSDATYIISDNHAVIVTSTRPEGITVIRAIDGRQTTIAIPAGVEPLAFNDNDDDGLHNALELFFGTDPERYDSDDDGVSDYDELNMDGDPFSYIPGADTDPLFNDNDSDQDGINNNVDPLPDTFNYNDGDLAPLGAPDGLINAADYLIAIQITLGKVVAGEEQLAHGDVYPVGAPDGVINIQDAILIQQQVLAR